MLPELPEHLLTFSGGGIALRLRIEIVLPGCGLYGTAPQHPHVEAVFADNLQALREGARHVVHPEQKDEGAVLLPRRDIVLRPGKNRKPGGIVLALIDIMVQNGQSVQLRRGLIGDGSLCLILPFGDPLRSHRRILFHLFPEPVLCDIGAALAEGLGMAHHRPDILHVRARHTQKIVDDGQIVDPVHMETSVEHQVHHLAHLAGIAVLDGEHRIVALPLHHGEVRRIKGRTGHVASLRENGFGRHMGKGAFDTAVGHSRPGDQTLLILPRNRHGILHELPVILPDHLILYVIAVALQNLLFLLLIQHRKASLPFIGCHIPYRFHALLKEVSHLPVHLFNHLSRILQFSHESPLLPDCPPRGSWARRQHIFTVIL